jgi:rubrerythrin
MEEEEEYRPDYECMVCGATWERYTHWGQECPDCEAGYDKIKRL